MARVPSLKSTIRSSEEMPLSRQEARWRDPDSNRGHHDFQSTGIWAGKGRKSPANRRVAGRAACGSIPVVAGSCPQLKDVAPVPRPFRPHPRRRYVQTASMPLREPGIEFSNPTSSAWNMQSSARRSNVFPPRRCSKPSDLSRRSAGSTRQGHRGARRWSYARSGGLGSCELTTQVTSCPRPRRQASGQRVHWPPASAAPWPRARQRDAASPHHAQASCH